MLEASHNAIDITPLDAKASISKPSAPTSTQKGALDTSEHFQHLLQEELQKQSKNITSSSAQKHASSLNASNPTPNTSHIKSPANNPTSTPSTSSPLDAMPSASSNMPKDPSPAIPPKKKSLNDMAHQAPKPSLLDEITKKPLDSNASSAQANPQANIQSNPIDPQASLTASSMPSQPITVSSAPTTPITPSSSIDTASSTLMPSTSHKNSTKHAAQTPPIDSTPSSSKTHNKPTLQDVITKANELELNPSKATIESSTKDNDSFKNSIQSRMGIKEVNGGIRQFFDKHDEQALRPFFAMFNSTSALDAARRKQENRINRLEYSTESNEKIFIIHRGKTPPANITQSRLRNERQEKVFEQIQQDLLAGKELDLDKIKTELFTRPSPPQANTTTSQISLPQPPQHTSATPITQALLLAQSTLDKKPHKHTSQTPQHANTQSQKSSALALESLPTNSTNSAQSTLQNIQELNNEPLLEGMPLASLEHKESSEQDTKKNDTHKPKPLESKLQASAQLGVNTMRQEFKPPYVREAIHSFIQQFDDGIKKFIPPMTRISLELSPKELGDLQLTITQRGKNLHVNVASNPNALNLFAQHQSELRQNLIAQGFEGINLSFSHHGGQQEQSHKQHQQDAPWESTQQAQQVTPTSTYEALDITLPLYA